MIRIFLEPGNYVRHPDHPEWGIGQVQSVAGTRITVNFQEEGKKTINGELVSLTLVDRSDL